MSGDDEGKCKVIEFSVRGVKLIDSSPHTAIKESENTFFIKYGYIQKREEKYWFRFGGSGHGGPDIIQEITAKEYIEGSNGLLNLELFLEKYHEKSGDYERSAVIRKRWIDKGSYYETNEMDNLKSGTTIFSKCLKYLSRIKNVRL